MEAPRAELGEHAPKIETIKIPVDKIREVIGSGGKVIREITAETGAKIDIGEDGTIKIAAAEQSKIDAAKRVDQAPSPRSPNWAPSTPARS